MRVREDGEEVVDQVRQAREELKNAGLLGPVPASGVVPEIVVRSWRRSIGGQAESESPPNQRFTEIDADSILRRAADPVLDRWQSQLADTGATLFLSDRGGGIVARRASDSSVQRRLDKLHAAEGFDYSEEAIGTNGLGTSMVEGVPVFIEGTQHYNDALAGLACAAAPVLTPSGAVIGSISLGGPRDIASPLMMSLTREIGQQIEERLRASSRPEDLALAMSFMRYANSQRPTIVVDQESLLANNPGLPYVSVTSHVLLWEVLSAHDWRSTQRAAVHLPGLEASVVARRVTDGPRPHYVVHFAELPDEPEFSGASVIPSAGSSHPDLPESLENRPTDGARAVVEKSDPAVALVVGPRGSGRATAARSLRGRSTASLIEVGIEPGQPTDWQALAVGLANGDDVLLRRIEDIPVDEAVRLATLVADHENVVRRGRSAGRLLLTGSRSGAGPVIRGLIDRLGAAVTIPPLTDTPERIPGLVRGVLDDIDTDGSHTLTPAALQALTRWDWPGNIGELRSVVADLVSSVSAPVIERRHLPGHLRNAESRRSLPLLERAERDAIVEALDAAGGNKSAAAELLGIGRTTLYRRIKYFGLGVDESSL